MKYIHYPLIILLLIVINNNLLATAQVPDILIYKGDTLILFTNPLEYLYEHKEKPDFWEGKEACTTTACGRGYQAEWLIENDNLYLTNIFSCCYNDGTKADLKKIFGNKYINGRVNADWYTGVALAPQGKLLYYVHDGYESVYERELELQFIAGKLIDVETFDNTKTQQSEYSRDFIKLSKYIYSNIQWERFDIPPNEKIKVIVQFSANEQGIIDKTIVVKGYSDVFDKEALRVVKSIPNWSVVVKRGKLVRKNWNVPVIFNEENKKKYINAKE